MKILIAEPEDFSQVAISILEEKGEVTCRSLPQTEIRSALTQYDVIWIRLGLTIRKKDIPVSPRCRYVITATTGLNHLDMDTLKEAGIEVLSLKGQTSFLETVTATAEHTMGLLLALVRMIPAAHRSVLNGIWNRDFFKGHEITGKIVGIVGYGRLGKIVSSYCRAFGMNVMIYDPFVKVSDVSLRVVDTLEEVFHSADFITLHIPLNAATTGLIDRTVLSGMKPGSYLINTSRGEIVVEDHLLEVLTHKKIAGAALDVLCDEEFFSVDNPLVQFAQHNENLLLTPHIGGCTWESMSKCEEFMAKKLKDAIK